MDDWGSMVMAKPSWMAAKGYPAQSTWPGGELQFDARYVWAHGEFTPQQTMRGKQALYGYLYAVGRAADATNRPPTITAVTVTPATLAIP
jgi:hypothetical protein